MATWTAKHLRVSCGACPSLIPAREPVCELLKGLVTHPKLRCVTCAAREGFAFDAAAAQAVEDAVIELEREDRIAAQSPLTPAQALHQTTARVTPHRKPRPFTRVSENAGALPFDHKAAQAGGDR